MTLRQKRRRRVELMIDRRLVGFLKPPITVSSPVGVPKPTEKLIPDVATPTGSKPEHKAS